LNVFGAPSDSPVPDAVGRVLQGVQDRVGAEKIDRVWIFPPLIRGRKEWGLVAVSGLTEDPLKRTLYTARYSAELTGTGTSLTFGVTAEGEAPPDRLPRVMDGVARRSDLQLGEAREIEIGGDPGKLFALVREHGGVDEPPPPQEAS
jgi:hypothetical protein